MGPADIPSPEFPVPSSQTTGGSCCVDPIGTIWVSGIGTTSPEPLGLRSPYFYDWFILSVKTVKNLKDSGLRRDHLLGIDALGGAFRLVVWPETEWFSVKNTLID